MRHRGTPPPEPNSNIRDNNNSNNNDASGKSNREFVYTGAVDPQEVHVGTHHKATRPMVRRRQNNGTYNKQRENFTRARFLGRVQAPQKNTQQKISKHKEEAVFEPCFKYPF